MIEAWRRGLGLDKKECMHAVDDHRGKDVCSLSLPEQ
jgi:hypothetical protein